LSPETEIRPIAKTDEAAMAAVIRTVMPEFGASGPGFAIHDPEVSCMFDSYNNASSAYFVLTDNGRVIGGGGIAPLTGGDEGTCELRKMYFLAEARGRLLGQRILDTCLGRAKEIGYMRCYLETLENMNQAKRLYERNGFVRLSAAMGSTGHFSCDAWYLKSL
jgi:putative acetyltransferase